MSSISTPAPHIQKADSVSQIMLHVILALIPSILIMFWLFGWGILINILLASLFALVSEGLMLYLRKRPLATLQDNSALVSAWLLALALPPLAPWWLVATGICFAMLFVKHLYGGLGFNFFNPAMAGYVVLLISFPLEMTRWIIPEHGSTLPDLAESLRIVFTLAPPHAGWDAITRATVLDSMKTQLQMLHTIYEIQSGPAFGIFGGYGWEWINASVLLGGLWLLYRRIISWHVPVGMLGALLLLAGGFSWVDPAHHPGIAFHLLSGGTLLGAFFIATDPVSCCTSLKGKLIFGAGTGILTFLIRSFGSYPDGIAFAVLLMNLSAPLLDRFTKPRAYGHSTTN